MQIKETVMSQFDQVIHEFQQRRIEKEIKAQKVKFERMQQLQEMADLADMEMRQRRAKKQHYYNTF